MVFLCLGIASIPHFALLNLVFFFGFKIFFSGGGGGGAALLFKGKSHNKHHERHNMRKWDELHNISPEERQPGYPKGPPPRDATTIY